MNVVAGGQGRTGASAVPQAGASPQQSPVGSPMTTPQPSEGEQMAAMIDISMARDLLEKTLPAFGAESKQGQAIMKALTALTREFGMGDANARQMVPAELKQLMAQQGSMTPELQALQGGGAPMQ